MNFKENIYHQRKVIGEATGILRAINLPFINQMRVGVFQNKGLWFSSKPVLGDIGSSKTNKLKTFSLVSKKIMDNDGGMHVVSGVEIAKACKEM